MQNHQLLDYEFNILLRGSGDLLRQGNVRGFIEKMTLPDSQYYFMLKETGKSMPLKFGIEQAQSTDLCVEKSYFEFELKFCRPFILPWSFLAIIGLLFTLLTIASVLILFRLNSDMVRSFKNLFSIAMIPYEEELSFSKAWDLASNMANQFLIYQRASIDIEKKKAVFMVATQVAHDIRSPLTAINMVLLDAPGLSPARRDLLEQASFRINAIAEELLVTSRKFGRYESSESIEIENRTLKANLFECIRSAVAEKGPAFKRGVIYVDDLTEDLTVFAESLGLQRILLNLIQNSIEAMEETDAPSIRISVRVYSKIVQVIIADNGKGISHEVLHKIGNHGFSYDKPNGNGLGISYAKKRLNEWGGDFSVSSQLGQGTMVSLTLKGLSIREVII
jgi:signal transduction histidine kinase